MVISSTPLPVPLTTWSCVSSAHAPSSAVVATPVSTAVLASAVSAAVPSPVPSPVPAAVVLAPSSAPVSAGSGLSSPQAPAAPRSSPASSTVLVAGPSQFLLMARDGTLLRATPALRALVVMGNVVNLGRARKRKQQAAEEQRADENAIRHGRTKAEKARERMEQARLRATVDGARRGPVAVDGDDDDDGATTEPDAPPAR